MFSGIQAVFVGIPGIRKKMKADSSVPRNIHEWRPKISRISPQISGTSTSASTIGPSNRSFTERQQCRIRNTPKPSSKKLCIYVTFRLGSVGSQNNAAFIGSTAIGCPDGKVHVANGSNRTSTCLSWAFTWGKIVLTKTSVRRNDKMYRRSCNKRCKDWWKKIKVSGYIQGKIVAIAPLKNNKGIHRS